MRDPILGVVFFSRFQLSAPSTKLVEKGINHEVENALYNYTNVTLMIKS
jgi:hypothetical protein